MIVKSIDGGWYSSLKCHRVECTYEGCPDKYTYITDLHLCNRTETGLAILTSFKWDKTVSRITEDLRTTLFDKTTSRKSPSISNNGIYINDHNVLDSTLFDYGYIGYNANHSFTVFSCIKDHIGC